MTIHELLALTGLTANDEIPVWDAEASGEPTKKITAQNFAAAIKTLASLLGTGDVVIVAKNVSDGREYVSNEIREIAVDISTLLQTYSQVYFMNFAGAAGANYVSFQFAFAYRDGNNIMVGVRNNSTSAKTLASIDVVLLCIK